jgi:imidazolonepropionase-like amidohydrolase
MIVIDAGLLIDGNGGMPVRGARLLVEGEKIQAVATPQTAAIPEGADYIDARAETVMPGMIDAHVHTIWSGVAGDPLDSIGGMVGELPGAHALASYAHARQDLLAGFTSLRDMLSLDFADVALRDAIQRGWVKGPRISACGYGLTSTGGHMDLRSGLRPDVSLGIFDNVVDTPDQARTAVRTLVRMRVDHIKINVGRGYRVKGRPIRFAPEMRPEVIQTIVEEAHIAGRKVGAHSLGSAGEFWAVEAGVDSLEHAHFIDEATIQLMAECGTYLVPTMTHCVRNKLALEQTLPESERAENLIFRAYESMYRVIPRALELGVRIATGTDAGAENVPHGCNAQELELLTTVGMTPLQAITAATRTAAEVLDLADTVGTLAPGRAADLLVVHGDPSADIRLLQDSANLLVVMKAGEVLADRRCGKFAL